jgi:hypothetical protein
MIEIGIFVTHELRREVKPGMAFWQLPERVDAMVCLSGYRISGNLTAYEKIHRGSGTRR